MPKVTPGIPDEIVLAKLGDRDALCDELWLIPAQVGMLLGRSQDQLEEDRKVGNPPPAMRPWSESGPVRYKLGTVRDMMLGPASEEYANTRAAKEGVQKRALRGFSTFADWLDEAKPRDEWPFLIRKGKAPIDFWKSLSMGEKLSLSDDDDCGLLNLDEYLNARAEAAWIAEDESVANELDDVMMAGAGELKPKRT
jgi:hypothetical protein